MRYFLVVGLLLCGGASFAGTTFYVAHNGSEAWSGTLKGPNAAKSDGPFASITRARDEIRALKQAGGLQEPVTVLVRKGEYVLDKTLVLGPEDSGTSGHPIAYRAFPGETVTLSGGQPVRGWTKYQGGLYVADLAAQGCSDFRFRELFYRGQRQVLARCPNLDPAHPVTGGLLYVDQTASMNKNSFYYKPGSIPFEQWGALPQAEVNLFPYNCWDHNLIRVAKVDTEMSLVTLKYPVAGSIFVGNRYFIQNVFAALDAPGEWYSDWSTGKLYFRSPDGSRPADGDVTVPMLENLVELAGTPDKPIANVRLQGFRLTCARQDAVALEGARDCEITGNTITQVGGVGVNVGYLRNAIRGIGLPWRKTSLARNALHSGDRALQFGSTCSGCRVAGNDIDSVGGDGLVLGGNKNTADNNHLSRTGIYDRVCAGLTICGDENLASHNAIHDVPRDGLFVNGKLNIAEYNDIRNTMLYTADDGAISLRQHDVNQGVRNVGNVLRFNRLLDTVGYGSYPHCTHPGDGFGSPFCSFGIYLDGSICGVTVYGNVIARTGGDSVFVQFGGDNKIENNIFVEADAKRTQFDAMVFFGTFMFTDTQGKYRDQEPPNQLRHNIFSYGGPNTDLYREGHWDNAAWDPRQAQFDSNLIWHRGQPVTVAMERSAPPLTLAQWQAQGHDTNSIVADPLFVDPARDDYRLKPGSPAYRLGFQDINADLAKIGTYQSEERASWPLKNAVFPRETPVVFAFPKETKPIIDGFERSPVGFPPAQCTVSTSGTACALVTDEAAKDGRHSLKFVDSADATNPWEPHLYYNPDYRSGKIHLSLALMNSATEPADFYVEFRDWEKDLRVGPSLRVTREGKLLMNDRMGTGGTEIADVPKGVWYNVSMDFELGEKAAGTYALKLSVPGRPDVVKTMPFPDAAFRHVTWFGLSSTATERTVFYVDNLILGPADLEKVLTAPDSLVIKGTNKPEATPKTTLTDPDQLAGYWKFEEDSADLTDSSGNGLSGEQGGAGRARGAFGKVLYLDGGGGGALIPDSPLLQFGTGSFSLECWLYPVSLEIASEHKRRRIIGKEGWPQSYWDVDVWSDGRVQMEMADGNVKNGTTISAGTIPEKAWTHLVIVVDRAKATTRYYFNGKLDSEMSLPPGFTDDLNVSGKSLSVGSWQPFMGLLSGLKVYRRALSAD
ncbi:MAG: LamG-like jellyroll fold domain-containing protein, partial [Armatimonadota bacterium]